MMNQTYQNMVSSFVRAMAEGTQTLSSSDGRCFSISVFTLCHSPFTCKEQCTKKILRRALPCVDVIVTYLCGSSRLFADESAAFLVVNGVEADSVTNRDTTPTNQWLEEGCWSINLWVAYIMSLSLSSSFSASLLLSKSDNADAIQRTFIFKVHHVS